MDSRHRNTSPANARPEERPTPARSAVHKEFRSRDVTAVVGSKKLYRPRDLEARWRSGQTIQLRGGVHEVRRREAFRERAVNGGQFGAGLVAMRGALSGQSMVRTMRKRAFPAIIFA